MSDYTHKELLEAIYDVRDRVTRIEEGLKRQDKLEDKIDEAYDKGIEAKDIAEEAKLQADQNSKDIQAIRTTIKWSIGTIVAIAGVIGTFLGIK